VFARTPFVFLWGPLATILGDALPSERTAASRRAFGSVREIDPAAVLANVFGEGSDWARVTAAGTAARLMGHGGGSGRKSTGLASSCLSSNSARSESSAGVRTPLNLPAHPTQRRALSLFAVWHASQYLVMSVSSGGAQWTGMHSESD